MKSYFLAITITMFLSALFAFQNIGDVTVRFLTFEFVFPQGVWEVLIFCAGAAIMWIFSIFSMLEMRSKYKLQLKQKDDKIAAVESEKKAILDSVAAARSVPAASDSAQTPQPDGAQGTEETAE
ncbi:MAG: LapA family protein [Synergistaceae bacterium]|nr:LapA family protein [Synergistaceae bacterium]